MTTVGLSFFVLPVFGVLILSGSPAPALIFTGLLARLAGN